MTDNDERYRASRKSDWPARYAEPAPERLHTVTFACGHTANFPEPVPAPGELVHCVGCRAYHPVTTAPPRNRRGGRPPGRR